tara:strand:+ start:98 stop:790 length:693 start_codon:yes stop_codon:yes gene_type:complete
MTTEKPKSLADALRLFQMKVKAAPKSGFTKFPNPREYSKLEDVLQIVQYAHELGISHTQTGKYIITEQGDVIDLLITTLHFGDEKLESVDRLPPLPTGKNTSQEDGIRRTYLKKYALSAIYGIGSDDDDDANSLTPPPEKEKGTRGTPTKPNEKIKPVSDKAKTDPPITNEAREVLNPKLLKIKEQHPDEFQKLLDSYKKKFGVSKINPITTAKQGEFLALAISKIDDSL